MPNFSKPFRLETDASDYDYGAILSQQSNDGHWLPVTYMSKQMLLAECNYVIYNKELLAIIEALKLWRHYLDLGGMAIASMARRFHFPIFGSFSSSVPCQHVFSSGK